MTVSIISAIMSNRLWPHDCTHPTNQPSKKFHYSLPNHKFSGIIFTSLIMQKDINTCTIQSSLKTESCPVSTTDSTPATLWPRNALRALSELEALGRAGVFIREQTATLTRLTAQWNKGGAHTLEKKEDR